MPRFVKLTRAFSPNGPIWVNLDLVREMTRQAAVDDDYQGKAPERTCLSFDSTGNRDNWDVTDVAETPDEILAKGNPENACPDPPGECGYYTHYLAYGGPDLTHVGYHAAEKLAETHLASCRLMETRGECSACTRHEERLRS